jgi:hypothetical protein
MVKTETKVKKQTPTQRVSKGEGAFLDFKASNSLPTDLYTPAADVPSISEGESQGKIEHIKGQQRALDVARENVKVAEKLYSVEEAVSKASVAKVKSEIGWEKYRGELINLEIQKIKTESTAQNKLQAQAQYEFDVKQTQFHQQALDIKAEGLEADVKHARSLLDLKLEAFGKELQVARKNLDARFEKLLS